MPTNIAGNSANFPTYVRAPSGSDARNATTIATPLQDLADRTAYLAARLGGMTDASGVWYSIPISTAGFDSKWSLTGPAGTLYGLKTLATDATSFYLPLSAFLPPAGMISDIMIGLIGLSHTGKPATLPCAKLLDITLDDNLTQTTLIDSDVMFDSSDLTLEQYDAVHSFGVQGYSMNLLDDIDLAVHRNLLLKVYAETGTNTAIGTTFFNVRAKIIPAHYNSSG